MTKDDRTALYGVVSTFVPTLTADLDHTQLIDEHVLLLVGEAMAQMDAEIVELRETVETLRQAQLVSLGPSLEASPAGSDDTLAVVPPEQINALLRHHRVIFQDVHDEVYIDAHNVQRMRLKAVPRPAQAGDVMGQRDTEDALIVVLKDGKRHVLTYAESEVP